MRTVIVFLFAVVAWILIPQTAWAWGPITHVDYANEALQNLAVYGGTVKALLSEFPWDFLYGALAADITIGKDYVDYIHNCHNWRVGFLILNEASDDRQRSAAFGYLSHLAVDIVSHNYFVPYKTIFSYPTRTLGHVYWEMRFDSQRPKKIWTLAKKISEMEFSHNDALFERMLRRTIFSFRTNRRIFKSVLTLHKLRQWRTMMERIHDVSRFQLTAADIEDYRSLAVESVVAFLKDPENAPCTKVDPTGEAKILYAGEMRSELKKLTRRKIISKDEAKKFLSEARKGLRDTIYKSGILPTVSDFIR